MFFDPLRVLLPVAVTFIILSVAVGLGSAVLLGKMMDVTTVVLFVSGVQILMLGLIGDMLNRRVQ